ncbi:Hypothetical predicted protein, partial [Mytilus galloprovincialis]
VDFSRKGSIDVKIIDLSIFINNQKDYFTTSSCSGRIILFDDSVGESDKVTNKQGCQWLFTSHDLVDKSQMMPVLEDITGDCVFKFEPFVLHVQCRTIDFAQLLLQCAVQSGFRNSGISLGKKGKYVVGVRSTHSMEVPLSQSGQLLVSTEYVEYLISLANKKMEENFRRIDRFFENLKSAGQYADNTIISLNHGGHLAMAAILPWRPSWLYCAMNILFGFQKSYANKSFVLIGCQYTVFNNRQQEPADTGLEILNLLRYVRPGAGYDPNFVMMEKVDVNGANEHPLFTYLKKYCPPVTYRFEDNLFYSPLKNGDIRWNFEQFIIDRNRKAVLRYSSDIQPVTLEHVILIFIAYFTIIIGCVGDCRWLLFVTNSRHDGDKTSKFENQSFEILAFPCNDFELQQPEDTGTEILNGIKYVRPGNGYVPKFQMFWKVDVNGAKEHPLYTFLKKYCPPVTDKFEDSLFYSPLKNEDVRWNYEQFVIDKNGKPVLRYDTGTQPIDNLFQISQNILARFAGINACPHTASCYPVNDYKNFDFAVLQTYEKAVFDNTMHLYREKLPFMLQSLTNKPTSHYIGYNALKSKFDGKSFEILAFPCNDFYLLQPEDTGTEILNGIKYVRPGNGFVPKFPVFWKVDVNGAKEHPLFTFLKKYCPPVSDEFEDGLFYSPKKNEDVRWNYEQFIIDKNGKPVMRYDMVVTTETALSVLAGIGCYKENKRRRYFSRNPGDFDPGALTPTVCAAKCGSFKFSYAAIAEGRFCFCGDALPDNSLLDSSKCTDKCSGDVLQDCGSKDYVSVFTAAPPILGLTLASDAGSNVVQIGNEVTFSASISSGGANLAFKMDYDDGAGKTDQNATNLWKRTYNTPGHYKVSVYGNDQMESLMEKEATTSVMIDSPVKTYTLTCPAYMATHEEDFCTVSVLEGSNLELQYSVDSVLKSTFSIADPPIYITGPAIPTKGGTTVVPGETGTGSFIVMPASEFLYKSVVIGFEMYAEAIGNIDILIMSPACNTPSYCFDKNDCSSGCSGIHERSCISKEFCPSSMSCWTSGSSTCDTTPVRYDGTQRTNLNIVRTVTHNILSTGYNYIPIDATADYIQVENGYILGYKPTGGRLNAVSANAIETDIKSTDVTNAGNAGPLSSPLKRHLLRAITSGGSDAYIPVKFTTSGIKDISITVSNKRISGSESNTTQINVMEGVDMAITNIPQYIEKGLATTFQLLPHTGTNVTYWWDFGDGITALNTTDATYDYTYTTVGEMNVSITAFNQMSSKSNMTIVQVQDKIRNLALVNSIAVVGETTSIPTSMTTGSNYTCTWKRDGVVIATTDDISSPPGGTFDYTFTEEGTYEISVVCSNQINSMSAVATFTTQFKITNLQLVKTGALKDSTFTIDWTWTAGSIPQFILEYDSQVRTFTKDPYFNKASSESLSAGSSITKYPLNLTAFNLVSNEQIVIDFGIEEELTGPSITIGGVSIDPVTGYGTISKNDQVSFTVDATGGTNVVIEWKYNDGTPDDSFTIPIWTATPAQTKNHQFSSLGWFNVEVKIYNLYNSHSQTFRLLAIAPIQNLVMNISPDPVLFLPPATVTFTFSKSVPTDPDPNEASVSFNYGDGKSETVPFDVNQQYTHEFRETSSSGTYTITTNISNVISHLILNGNVKVVEKIEDVEIVPDPEYAAVGDPVNVKVTMRRGDTGADLTLDWDLGDGTAVTSGNRIGVSPSGSDTKVATYPTEGTRTIKITAKSTMETIVTTKDIICQRKITEDPVVTSNHPQNFNLGGRIDFTFLYSGTPAPTAATVLVNYGDGTEEYRDPPWLTTKSGSTQLFDHTYTSDGNYVTTVTLSNLVSTKIFQISSGVYLTFVGLAVVPKFIKFIPINGPDVDGFGSNKDIFQLDRPVRFHMSKTEGTFVYYSISASNGAVVIMCNKTTEDVFEIKFNETGTYTVVITAHNPIDSKSVTTTIEVMKAVLDVSVADNGQTTSENEAKLFDISFVEPGTKTCVHIDYGDGIAEMFGDSATCTSSSYAGSATYISTFSGSSFQATHTYTSKNTYDVRVHAFNAHSTSDYSVFHVVSSIDCSQPQIDIKNKYVKFWEPEEIEKSSRIRVIGVTKIDCGSLLQNVKQWSVESVDEQYGTTMSSIDCG